MKLIKQGVLLHYPAGPNGTGSSTHFSGWEFEMDLGEKMPATEEELFRARLRLILEHVASGASIDLSKSTTTRVSTSPFQLVPIKAQPPASDGGTTKESAHVQEESPGAVDGRSSGGSNGEEGRAPGQEGASQEEGQVT